MAKDNKKSLNQNKLEFMKTRGIMGFAHRRNNERPSMVYDKVIENALKKNDKSKKLLGL